MKKNRGFTLIELLVVITIILALAGLVIGGAQKARIKAGKTKAQAMISTLETALSMYEVDYGEYPAAPMSNVINKLTENQGDNIWDGPYVMIKEDDIEGDDLVDPWGNPYVYAYPATHNDESYFDIYSKGPDGEGDGTKTDDVNNW